MANKKKSNKKVTPPVAKPGVAQKASPAANAPVAENSASNNSLQLIWKISLAVVLLLMLGMSFSYGLSGDEVDMNEYGKAILNFYTSFGADETVFNMPKEYDRDSILKYYGGFYDTICAVVTKVSPFELFTTRHLMNALMGFLAIFFASKITKKIIGTRAAIIAVWVMFLSPFFLGHAMHNPKDIPMAAFWVMALYGMIRLFTNLPKATWKDYLFAILPMGFTIASRVGGILLIPEMFVLVGLLWFFNFRKDADAPKIPALVKSLAIVSIGGYLAGCLFWPYGLVDPINNPLFALKEMTNLSVGMRQIFEGAEMFSTELPAYYLPKIFTMTNTIAFLVGLALMFAFLWPFRKNKHAALLYFVAFTAFFPFFYIIYSKSNVFHAWRHTLFIFPSAIVCASFGWEQLTRFFAQKKLQVVGLGALGALLLLPIYFIISTFPHTNTFYNSLYGGVQKAYGDYEVDFYYNGLKESAEYFIDEVLPQEKDSVLVVTNAVHLLPHYFPKDAKVKFDYIRYRERNQKDWDYAIYHIALIPRDDMIKELWLPTGSTVYKTQVKGKTLSAIIKRKSKSDIIGMQYLQAGNIDSAIYHFEKYLASDDKNVAMMNKLGEAYLQKQDIGKAREWLEKAMALNPSDLETNYIYGRLQIELKNYADAQNRFAAVLKANPNFVQGYFYIGICQMGMGNFQAAIQSFNTASQAPNLKAPSYKYMGDCYAQLGNQAEANRFYQLAGAGAQ